MYNECERVLKYLMYVMISLFVIVFSMAIIGTEEAITVMSVYTFIGMIIAFMSTYLYVSETINKDEAWLPSLYFF